MRFFNQIFPIESSLTISSELKMEPETDSRSNKWSSGSIGHQFGFL